MTSDVHPPCLKTYRRVIDASLSYSLRMISDAHMLEADKRFLSAIPLYILALEELGKSQHLIAKHVRRIRVTEEEWRKLTSSPHAHFKKIAVRYADAIKLLTRFTDKEIAGYRAWERQKGLYFPVLPREQMITQYKRALSIIEKLPFVKMACLYVDYYQAKWLSLKTYGSDMLNDICVYLYYESMIMYYSAKLNLFGHTLSLKSKKVTVEKEKAYLENENLFALHVLRSKVHETSFVRAREHAFAVMEVIAAEYKHLARRPTNAI